MYTEKDCLVGYINMRLLKSRFNDCSRCLSGVPLSNRLVCLCLLFMNASVILCQQQPQKDLTDKSLDELSNIQVTSVSKKEQSLFQAAAAIYVITQDDIRRSGLSSIPDLLRTVPGLDV